jgi:hypothetical protein
VNRPISAEPPASKAAVTEEINALLGDADAPDRWHYCSLQLLTAGEAFTGLQLAHHPVCADPQASSGWRCEAPVVTTFEGIHRLPACWSTSDASFEFVEIRERSLAEHLASLQILDDTMRRDALIPSQNRGAARAEMEISLTASQCYALLQAKAIQKASLFSTLLQHWCALTGEHLDPGAGLQVTVSPLTPPIQPQLNEWIEFFDKGVISREELRHQLALATANAISSPTLDVIPATRAREGSKAPEPE